MRYSSASGPNSIDSGIATAPSRYSAMCATAVSKRCGMTMRDAVAARDAEPAQRGGEPVGVAVELGVA